MEIQEKSRKTVETAQALRFLAALLIVIDHSQFEAVDLRLGLTAEWRPFPWGIGVDIFFVISGFVMYYTSHDDFNSVGASKRFFLRRLLRIVPPYWLFTGLTVLAALIAGDAMRHNQFSFEHLFASLFFIPWPRPGGGVNPVLGLGWTLNYEMMFYTFFAVALAFPRRYAVPAIVVAFCSMAMLHPLVPADWYAIHFWTHTLIIEFLVGMGLAALYLRGYRMPPMMSVLVGTMGVALALLSPEPPLRALQWGGPAALIAASAILMREPKPTPILRLLSLLGGASYALYLCHPFVINILAMVWRKIGTGNPAAFIAISACGSIVASLITYIAFERPVGRWLSRKLFPKPAAASHP